MPPQLTGSTSRIALEAPTIRIRYLSQPTFRAGRGWQRNIVTNVFSLDPITRELRCQGYGGGGAQPLLRDVAEFKVFYRFDDAARAAGANGVTNAAPFGGSIRDAAYIAERSKAA